MARHDIKVKKPSYMQKTARCIQRFLFDVYIYAAMASRAEPNDPLYLNEQVFGIVETNYKNLPDISLTSGLQKELL